MENKIRYYDNTRLSTFKECNRKFYYRHIRDWRPQGTALALVFGLSWHEAMDVVWGLAQSSKTDEEILKMAMAAFVQCWKENECPWPLTMDQEVQFSPRTPGVAAEMLYSYIQLRRPFLRNVEILDIELPFAVPIDPNDPDKFYVGRLDKVFRHEGRIVVGEHKTTSAYATQGGFRQDYLESWSPNSQVDGYLHAASMIYGVGNPSVWIDAALVHKKVHDKFKFIPVDRQFAQLAVWLDETIEYIRRVEEEVARYDERSLAGETSDHFALFPKNTNSCTNWSGCSYRDICKFVVNPNRIAIPDGFVEEKWEPFDILELEKIGLMKE